MNDQRLFKGLVGGACAVFTMGRSALQQEIENCLWAGGEMKQVEGDVADRHTLISPPTHALQLVGSSLSSRYCCSILLFYITGREIICGSASELHGRDSHDERRRAGGTFLPAAEGASSRWIPSGGLGVVRLGLQDHRN